MGLESVWNITDDPRSEHTPVSMMVLGRNLKPGQRVQVDSGRLATAHKVHKDKDAGLLYIGNRPPADYLTAKNPPRVKLDPKLARAHGRPPISAVAAAAEENVAVELTEEVAPPEETLETRSSMGGSKKSKKNRRGGGSSSEPTSSEE